EPQLGAMRLLRRLGRRVGRSGRWCGMRAARLRVALLASALLLLQQFLEPGLLIWSEHFAKSVLGFLHFLSHQTAGALLAFAEDAIDARPLLSGEIQLALGAAQELKAKSSGGVSGGYGR